MYLIVRMCGLARVKSSMYIAYTHKKKKLPKGARFRDVLSDDILSVFAPQNRKIRSRRTFISQDSFEKIGKNGEQNSSTSLDWFCAKQEIGVKK